MPKIGDRVKIINGKWGIVKYIDENTKFIGIELNNWYENAGNGEVKGIRYFESENGKAFFVKFKYLIGKEWKIEKLLWIAFYKNEKNEKCLIATLPKEIVTHIVGWL